MNAKTLVLGLVLLVAGIGQGAPPAVAAELEVQPSIGGSPMRCSDFRGVVVRTLRTTELGDVGRASIIGRIPVIQLDAERLKKLPPKLQIFFFMHECAHHVLGHILRPTLESEREADCWSANRGRGAGLFTREDVIGFGPYFARSPGSRFGHLPGLERQAYILSCFDRPESAPVALFR